MLIFTSDMAGASAELIDVTPGAVEVKWQLAISTKPLILDSEHFIPSHVYQVRARRGTQPLGAALIYLYPPPLQRSRRVTFQTDERQTDAASHLVRVPKSSL